MDTKHSTEPQIKDQKDHGLHPGADARKTTPWKKPMLEDVSGKVMAQPYIRFT